MILIDTSLTLYSTRSPARLLPQLLDKLCLHQPTDFLLSETFSKSWAVCHGIGILKNNSRYRRDLWTNRVVRHRILRSSRTTCSSGTVKDADCGCYIPRLNRRHSMEDHRLKSSCTAGMLVAASFFTSFSLWKSTRTQTIRKIVTFFFCGSVCRTIQMERILTLETCLVSLNRNQNGF